MISENSLRDKEFTQILNTAIIKSKERRINSSYEERLSVACQRPALKALNLAVNHLSELQKISKDQAAIELVETVRELDSIWDDYVKMEGLGKLKELLKSACHPS